MSNSLPGSLTCSGPQALGLSRTVRADLDASIARRNLALTASTERDPVGALVHLLTQARGR